MRTPTALALTLVSLAAATALAAETPKPQVRPRLDVAFILDTTGSMGDEIDVVKEKLVSISQKLQSGQPAPDVRFAVIAFRDKGDAYVTRVRDFDRDVKKVQREILSLDADGGGDEPEDVSAALNAALKLSWDSSPNVARVAFLVGDAGPQHYEGEPTWQKAATNLKERKITVHTMGCSGLNGEGLSTFKTLAERTSGEFEQLTYRRVEKFADGKSRTVLTTGGETYVAEGDLSEADWKKGADVLVKEGRARRDDAVAARGVGGGTGVRGPGVASAAPPAAVSETMNNLDAEISGRLLESAKSAGVAYEK